MEDEVERGVDVREEDTRGRTARKSIPSTQRQICDECGLLFAKHRDFLEHLAVFHDSKDPGRYYACGECAQLFPTAEERRLHDADHDAALIIHRAERSRRLRRALRAPREPLPPEALRPPSPPPPPPPPSQPAPKPLPSVLSQPLRLEIEPTTSARGPSAETAARTQPLYGTISAPATPQSAWSPPTCFAGTAAPPPPKRVRAPGSAPLTPSDLLFNPPPPEPSPTAGRKSAFGAAVWNSRHLPEPQPCAPPPSTSAAPLAKVPTPAAQVGGPAPASASWSKCPRCQVYEGLGCCPFCSLETKAPSDCLLHIVQEHRSNTGLYESPDWAHRVVVSAEVVYASPQQEPCRELKFKINVTLKVRK